MKRLAVSILCSLFAAAAFAQCEVTFTTTLTQEGKARGKSVNTWTELDADDVTTLYTKGVTIVDVASKEQDKAKKGHGHEIDFVRKSVCAGTPPKAEEAVRVEGLTWQGVSKTLRQSNKVELELVKMGEDHHAKGKKSGWGKD